MNSLRIVNGERANDGQITKRRYSLWTEYDCNAYSKSPWKRIPMEVWEEMKSNNFTMQTFNTNDEYWVRSYGGKTYLVSIKE